MHGRVRAVTTGSGAARRALDRGWQCAPAPAGSILPAPVTMQLDRGLLGELAWIDAQVPGTAAGALRAAGQWSWDDHRDFDAEDWWWRVPTGGASGTLVIDGIATIWDAWLDGAWIGHGESMFRGFELDLPAGRELVICCRALATELAKPRARPRWKVPMIEQQQLRWVRTTLLGRTPGWSPPCAAVGPWRPMWIEPRAALAVGEVSIEAKLEAGVAFARVGAQLRPASGEVERARLVITGPGRGGESWSQELEREAGAWTGLVPLEAPALWWPHTHGEPALYGARVEVDHRGGTTQIDLGGIGFRSLAVEHEGGEFAVRVNGAPVFCRGACWTPLDAVTLGASREAYRGAVAQLVAAGANMVRIGGTMVYEDDALYDALDEQGVLLWQDLMFANMDYPEELTEIVRVEAAQQLGRLAARPALAIVCGNSEGEQQAAMWGATREKWEPRLFHQVVPPLARAIVPDAMYVPSSAHGGAFPHAVNAGPASYYGVGAYLRPLDDARRAEVRFASECLAFANIPAASGLPGDGGLRVHHAAWKARAPRDLGAGWDFDDVRDHYLHELYGVDPVALRTGDHERYLALGRAVTGEVMARCFAEWRRGRSPTRGALVWFARDLWPGAGWGIVDANGVAKPAWYALRRAWQPISLAITDEGVNGLALHAVNDRGAPLAGRIEVTLWRNGETAVGRGAREISVPAYSAIELAAAELFEGFVDLSFAYKFGPPPAHVVHATLAVAGAPTAEAFWFPAGMPSAREPSVGLTARARVLAEDRAELIVSTQRFAQAIAIDTPEFAPEDDGFHLAPGQQRTIALRRIAGSGALRGRVEALNAEASTAIAVEVPG